MANPNPIRKTANLRPPWTPGESGNPAGYSRGRRVSDALNTVLNDLGAHEKLARVWLAKAVGDKTALGDLDPDFRYFKELLDRVDGKVPAKAAVRLSNLDLEVMTDDELQAIIDA